MSKFETLDEIKHRVSKEELYDYYVINAHNQNDTRCHFGISRPKFVELLKLYDIKKTPEQILATGKNTNIKRHGTENYNNREKYFDTLTNKYGSIKDAYSSFYENSKITKFEKYGNPGYTNRDKAKQTLFEKTGYYYPHQSKESIEKASNTYLEKTGYANPSFNPEVKHKISQKLKNKSTEEKEIIKKKKQLFWENLSEEQKCFIHESRSKNAKKFHLNLSDEKKTIRNKKLSIYRKQVWANMTEEEKLNFKKVRINSMRERGTFNSSKLEEKIFSYLFNKYPDVIRQYSDERYPFNCDFYVPSKDLFIELNQHWTHGNMPYDPENKECQEKLNIWKSKSKYSNYYKNAIYTWTNLDVRKLNYFINNKLNYKIIYDVKKFNLEEL